MKRILKCLGIVLTFMVLNNQGAMAQKKSQWIKIAEKVVNYKAEKDEVLPYGNEKKVDKIRLRCTRGTVKIKHITIKMANGKEKRYNAKGTGVLNKGAVSFAWDVPDKDAKISKIILEYDSVGAMFITKKGKVEVEGRQKE